MKFKLTHYRRVEGFLREEWREQDRPWAHPSSGWRPSSRGPYPTRRARPVPRRRRRFAWCQWLRCSSLVLILSVQWVARLRAARFITLLGLQSKRNLQEKHDRPLP